MALKKRKDCSAVRLHFYEDCTVGGVAYEGGKAADVPAFLAHRLKKAGVAGDQPKKGKKEEAKTEKKEADAKA